MDSGGLACRVAKVVRLPNNPVSNYQDREFISYAVPGVDYQNLARSDSGRSLHDPSAGSYSMPLVFSCHLQHCAWLRSLCREEN